MHLHCVKLTQQTRCKGKSPHQSSMQQNTRHLRILCKKQTRNHTKVQNKTKVKSKLVDIE